MRVRPKRIVTVVHLSLVSKFKFFYFLVYNNCKLNIMQPHWCTASSMHQLGTKAHGVHKKLNPYVLWFTAEIWWTTLDVAKVEVGDSSSPIRSIFSRFFVKCTNVVQRKRQGFIWCLYRGFVQKILNRFWFTKRFTTLAINYNLAFDLSELSLVKIERSPLCSSIQGFFFAY